MSKIVSYEKYTSHRQGSRLSDRGTSFNYIPSVCLHFPAVKPNRWPGVSACAGSSRGRLVRGSFIELDGDAGFGSSCGEVASVEVLMRNNSDAAVSSSGVYTGEDDAVSLGLRRGTKPEKQG